MARNLENYEELQSTIADFLDRDDLDSQIQTFIALAELDIERDLTHKAVTRDDAFTIDSAAVALPSDCAELRSLRLNGGFHYFPVKIVTPAALADYQQLYAGTGGVPRFAAVVDSTLLLAPAPDSSYTGEIIYFTELTPLSDTQSTNTVLASAPDLYLYGALVQASRFLEHDERVASWKASYDEAVHKENIRRERQELGAAPQQARLPRVF